MATSGLGCGKPSLPLHKLACKMDLSLCKGSISEHWLSSWTPIMNKFLGETQISDPQLTSISTVPELCLGTLQGALWTRDLWINLNITTWQYVYWWALFRSQTGYYMGSERGSRFESAPPPFNQLMPSQHNFHFTNPTFLLHSVHSSLDGLCVAIIYIIICYYVFRVRTGWQVTHKVSQVIQNIHCSWLSNCYTSYFQLCHPKYSYLN